MSTDHADPVAPAVALEARPEVEGESISRVAMTHEALELLQKLRGIHGELMIHQSGGCCDGSSPMCYPEGDFRTGDSDILLGTFELPAADTSDASDDVAGDARGAGELPFWMSREQFEYWKHTHLTLDVVDGRGAGFSVEAPEGKRFLIRSRLMNPAETADTAGVAEPDPSAP
ncbi:DUF779 domain-containing protein [Citricoccus sp. NR2]|uniref:DUF779 domain-containing protein n=1 Tax=Citricoccus sp. NR2 TaxID=3004095 RepID=UPI0022DDD4AA|nr:DUF779 domain-containing protein [Citricoccus sp. NR2]WBL20076.1 DUF779 domain-containing protein [Citricoccus sp. NR2]